MQEKSKEELLEGKESENLLEEKPEVGEESSWSKDQEERSYYYDDSHGYQKYIPEEDSDENNN